MKKSFLIYLIILPLFLTGCESSNNSESTEQKVYTVGDTAILDGYEVRLDTIGDSSFITTNLGLIQNASAGREFLYPGWSVGNATEDDVSVSASDFECYIDNVLVEMDITTYSITQPFTAVNTLAPGKVTQGLILYQIPTGWKKGEFYFKTNKFEDERIIFEFTPDQVTRYS